MEFDKRTPCANCPFRTDVPAYLTAARVVEIAAGLERGTFACHKTVEYVGGEESRETDKTRHCAGAMILLEHLRRPSQMMRICERLGFYDHTKLNMKAPVFRTWAAMRDAQPQ